jgi:hypothetical protein
MIFLTPLHSFCQCLADVVPEDIDAAAESSIMERRPLLLTPVPHEQPWATAAWAGHPVEPPTPSELRL